MDKVKGTDMSEQECSEIANKVVHFALDSIDRKNVGAELPMVLMTALAAAIGSQCFIVANGDKEKYEEIRKIALDVTFSYIKSFSDFPDVELKIKQGEKQRTDADADNLVF